jgi:hypothetical protein
MPPSADALVVDAEQVDAEHEATELPMCESCGHLRELHDPIATRYCEASASSALSRGCVCRLPVPDS